MARNLLSTMLYSRVMMRHMFLHQSRKSKLPNSLTMITMMIKRRKMTLRKRKMRRNRKIHLYPL